MSPFRLFPLLAASFLALQVSGSAITVFSAASLTNAIQEVAASYEAESGDTVRFSFGSSGALSRQIKEGAPADVILSADELRVDQLESAGLVAPGTRRTILANQLVVVAPVDEKIAVSVLGDLGRDEVKRIAIGEPATVPVGTYTKAYLKKVGLWGVVVDKCIPLNNVRAVLAAVESGNVEVGFVYRTDALISKKAVIVAEVPLAEGPSITYPAAVLRDAPQPEAAARFVAFLTTPEARAIFAKYGFLPPTE